MADVKIERAIVSVYDKTGLVDFVKELVRMGVEILSTGGTRKLLAENGVKVRDISEYTGFPEMMDGRVKTLHPRVHGGLLAVRDNPEHVAAMKANGIQRIDMVVVNLYPFEATIARPGVTLPEAIEQIDIGGPSMIRSSAKNHAYVTVVTSPKQYGLVLDEMKSHGGATTIETRAKFAREVFATTSNYDGTIANYLAGQAGATPDVAVIAGRKFADIPKGENGHQSPAQLFATGGSDPLGLPNFKVIEGLPLSYNNWTDIDRLLNVLTTAGAGWKLNAMSGTPKIAVLCKHGNPCGAAVAADEETAVRKAVLGDTRAAFGGLLMCNFTVTEKLAEAMITTGMSGNNVQKFDSVIAPAFAEGAASVLERKKGKCRLVVNERLADSWHLMDAHPRFRYTRGGFLVQPAYGFVLDLADKALVVSGAGLASLSNEQKASLLLALAVNHKSNSNTITLVSESMLIGNGVGQQDRVGAAELVVKRAVDAGHKDKIAGAVACSDSFFPFPDAPEVLINAGVKTIFSTTGSANDKLTQELCRKRGVTLIQLPDAAARGFFGH